MAPEEVAQAAALIAPPTITIVPEMVFRLRRKLSQMIIAHVHAAEVTGKRPDFSEFALTDITSSTIAELREPTKAMIAAPDPWDGDQTYASVWAAMIDAALE